MDNTGVERLLANNLEYGEATGYLNIEPEEFNVSVSSGDGSTQFDVFRVELGEYEGETLTFIVSGEASGEDVALIAFDAQGNLIMPDVVTGTDEEIELPKEFSVAGNYPNPFNPSTSIQFNLPASAEVSVEVFDMLGRRVMALPVQTVAAGANRSIQVDGGQLASGMYLYRVVATMAQETKIGTGRMMLVK